MSVEVYVQSTPNPNAMKFILDRMVKWIGKATYHEKTEAQDLPLGQKLFEIKDVTALHFYENTITVSQNGNRVWTEIEEEIKQVLNDHLDAHDPQFKGPNEMAKPKSAKSPEVARIDEIIGRTIRPGLQGDGGDVEIIDFDPQNKVITVSYQGACGGCPSSSMGTLFAIQNILREEFDPEVEVVTL